VCSLSFALSNVAVLLALCSLRIKDEYFLEDCMSSPFHLTFEIVRECITDAWPL